MADNYQRTLKQHDTGEPVLIQICSEATGKPLDVTGATGSFLMYAVDGTELVNAPLLVQLPTTAGIIRYDWQAGDTDLIGRHRALFELTFAGATLRESYPREGYMWFTIEEALNET